MLVAARPFDKGAFGRPAHALVIGGLLVVPQPFLFLQGGQPEDRVGAELWRRADLPIHHGALHHHMAPPQEDVGPVERVQDQLVILEAGLYLGLAGDRRQDGLRRMSPAENPPDRRRQPERSQRRGRSS